jgi:hypothetical protein
MRFASRKAKPRRRFTRINADQEKPKPLKHRGTEEAEEDTEKSGKADNRKTKSAVMIGASLNHDSGT